MMHTLRSRAGFVFPVVLTALILFAVVGMTMMFTGSSEYAQTAIVIYGVVANQLAMGVLEEMQAVVYDRVNTLDPAVAVWRPELILAARAGDSMPPKDLLAELIDSKAAIDEMKGELVQAQVTFTGFRPMKYATKDTYDRDQVYYHDQQLDSIPVKAPGSPTGARDYTGYYKLEAAVRFGKSLRYYTVTHDLKIVDVSPPAREFALFAFNVFAQADKPYLQSTLNQGGPFNVYANDVGRIFIRGPYFLDVEDHPKGLGGDKPGGASKVTFLDTGKWWNWSLLPVYHEGLESGTFNHRDPGRPEKTSHTPLSLNFAGFDTESDPGAHIPNGTAWFVGSVPYGKTNFSIWGDPSSGRWHAYRGLKTKEDENGRTVGQGVFEGGLAPIIAGSGNEGDAIKPEGEGILGTYHVSRLKSWKFKIPPFGPKIVHYSVSTDRSKPIYASYGLRWEKKRKGAGGWMSLVIDVVSVASLGIGIAGAEGAAGAIFQTIGETTLQGIGADMAASMLFPPDALPPTGVSADDLLRISEKGYWPPNFKPYTRAATRAYDKLADAIGPSDILHLDGTIMVDQLELDRPLKYRGKGILSNFVGGAAAVQAKLPNGVQRDSTDQLGLESYLTIAYWTGEPPTSDEAMLELGMPEPGRANEATILSAGSIKPLGPKTAIQGGLVCLALNKDRIGDADSLEILYDREKLATADLGGTYDPEQWMVTSVSPKISGWSDRFVLTAGGGIAGGDDPALDGFAPF